MEPKRIELGCNDRPTAATAMLSKPRRSSASRPDARATSRNLRT